MKKTLKICQRCVMDTTDPDITFDDKGFCNKCTKVFKIYSAFPYNLSKKEKESQLHKLVKEISIKGKNKQYDSIVGVSGGTDSTFVLYKAKELGLRPLAVHFDNGWNSELAQNNIENAVKKLNIDLYTYVVNWEEFKDLQLSFLKASVPDCEIPTDHGIIAILYKIAHKYSVQYILSGVNTATESVGANAWSQGMFDWKYIKNLHRRFGTVQLKTFPHFSLSDLFYYRFARNIRRISLLDYVDYDREKATKILQTKLAWRSYGGKHYESAYTKFFQAYILPTKFGFDKRKAYLSSMICSGQMTRVQALRELKKPLYDKQKLADDKIYVAKKFGLTIKEFDQIMKLPPKKFNDYPSYQKDWYYELAVKLNEKSKSAQKHKYYYG